MAAYLVQVAYSSDSWARLIKNPQDRISVVAEAAKKLGGKLSNGWLSFGDYDVVAILEVPDNISAAAFAIALSAGGACKSMKTTPLLSVEDGLTAMKKAGSAGYQPPSG